MGLVAFFALQLAVADELSDYLHRRSQRLGSMM